MCEIFKRLGKAIMFFQKTQRAIFDILQRKVGIQITYTLFFIPIYIVTLRDD